MDKEQANAAADVLMENASTNNRPKAEPMASPQQKMRALGGLVGFGLGSLTGLFFFGSSFPSSVIGIAVGALAGHHFWRHLVRPKG